MKKLVRKLIQKVKDNPVRAFTIALSALTAALAAIGVTDGTVVQVLGQIGVILGGGEVARAKVTPEAKAQEQAARAYSAGKRQHR